MAGVRSFRRCLRDRGGASAIEYALLAALIAGVVIAAIGGTGRAISGLFAGSNTSISTEIAKSRTP